MKEGKAIHFFLMKRRPIFVDLGKEKFAISMDSIVFGVEVLPLSIIKVCVMASFLGWISSPLRLIDMLVLLLFCFSFSGLFTLGGFFIDCWRHGAQSGNKGLGKKSNGNENKNKGS